MLLKYLFKPKWEHPNPKIRRQALAALENDQDPILVRMALGDDEPGVRCVAVGRLADLLLLKRIAQEDASQVVRTRARERLRRLVAGIDPGIDVDERRAYVAKASDDPALLEQVATEGCEVPLRVVAVGLIRRESLLLDLAIHDASAEVRLTAVQRIVDADHLERVVRALRNRDRRASRIARERLAEYREARERPRRLRAQRQTLCEQAEALAKWTKPEGVAAALERLERQWRALTPEHPADADQEQRLAEARARIVEALAEQGKAAERRPLRVAEATVEHPDDPAALCARLETTLADLKACSALAEADETGLRAQLRELETQWQTAFETPDAGPHDRALEARYRQADEAVRERLRVLAERRDLLARGRRLCERMEAGLDPDQPPPSPADLKDLRHRWEALALPPAIAKGWGLDQRHAKALHGLEQRLDEHHARQQADAEQLEKTLDELFEALDQGASKQARRRYDRAQHLLRGLEGFQPTRRKGLEKRLARARPRLREMQDWERWGNTQERELLCEQAEALVGSDDEPPTIAKRVRTLRDDWNRLGASDRDAIGDLRERFNRACAKAYEPCERYYAEQSVQRTANLADRNALCQRLENFIAETDWEAMDLKQVERTLREARQAWKAIGPVDHKSIKQVSKRYWDAVRVVEGHLKEVRQANLEQKRRILAQSQGLLDDQDLRNAIAGAKRLQNDWKRIGPGPRREEQEVWTAFRDVCDRIFARREEQFRVRDEERRANLSRRRELIETAHALIAAAPTREVDELQRERRRLGEEWQALGDVPRQDADTTDKAFDAAMTSLGEVLQRQRLAARRAALDRMARKAALCAELENLVDHPEVQSTRRDELVRAWEAFEPIPTTLDKALRDRYEAALALLDSDTSSAERQARGAANLATADELCIRMEILAGVDSPPEAQRARMEYQVERLSAGMAAGADEERAAAEPQQAERIEADWWSLGPLPTETVEEQCARFLRARNAFYQQALGNDDR